MSDIPLVSVCMITYNHEKYIAEAIEGVLMQEVEFNVELVVADDASTDRTGEIIQSYIGSHPRGSWIKYTSHPFNKGMMGNFIWALEQCNGKFIALCDGDDYWTDPLKLQKQVDLLECNAEFSLCYHPVKILNPNGDIITDFIAENYFKASESSIYDLAIFGNYIHTPSIVFRKKCLSITKNFSKSPIGDYFLYLILGQNGKFARLDFLGGIYRLNSGSYSILNFNRKKEAHQKMLVLASKDMNFKLVSFILTLRVYHNSLVGKKNGELFISSGITGIYSFLTYINKVELLKSIIKFIFYKPIKVG